MNPLVIYEAGDGEAIWYFTWQSTGMCFLPALQKCTMRSVTVIYAGFHVGLFLLLLVREQHNIRSSSSIDHNILRGTNRVEALHGAYTNTACVIG